MKKRVRSVSDFEHDICLSFAGEERSYVQEVAASLVERGVRVFFDRYEEVRLWGKDLYVHLDEISRNSARYCVLFISKNYATKLWTNHERRSAQARAFSENEEYILPVRFDDTIIPGLRDTVGYIDLRTKAPQELAEIILQKLYDQSRPVHFLTAGSPSQECHTIDQSWESTVSITAVRSGRAFLRENIFRLYSVLIGPRTFISSLNYDSHEELIRASVFAIFINLLNLVITGPMLRFLRVETASLSFLLTDTVLTYATWLLRASLFHMAAKCLRGHGTYRSSVVAFLYLTAFLPALFIVSYPLEHDARRAFLAPGNALTVHNVMQLVTGWFESPETLIPAIIATLGFVYFYGCIVSVYCFIHSVGRIRGIFICLLGYALWGVMGFVSMKSEVILYQAYQTIRGI